MISNAPNGLPYAVYMPIDPRTHGRPFRMPDYALVQDLEDAIRHSPEYKILQDEDFRLYQCGVLTLEPQETLYRRVLEWLANPPKGAKMPPVRLLKRCFPNGPAPAESEIIDIVIVTDDILEARSILHDRPEIDILQLNKDRRLRIEDIKRLPSPSEGVKDMEGIKNSNDGSRGAHFHRPAGNYGPPTALFQHAFARLKHRLKCLDQLNELEPAEDKLEECHHLIRDVCKFYDSEKSRGCALKSHINRLIGVDGKWQDRFEDTAAHPDAIWGDRDMIRLILELKNEDGIKGNASLQAVIVYGKIVSQDKYERLLKISNCPVILVGMMGTRLEISTAIFTDGIYVDKLISQELYLDAWQSQTVLRLGRIFKAVSLAARELRDYYNIYCWNPYKAPTNVHLFPDPLPIDEGTVIPRLTYIGKLSRRGETIKIFREKERLAEDPERPYALYRAKMIRDEPEGEVDVVVKFTAYYNERAHRILAENGLAPTLHFFAPLVGGMNMVVMDYIQGPPLTGGKERPDYDTIYTDVEKAISLLHQEDIVFGDLRVENIIRKPSGGGMLIDFDWAGRHQETKYPASWSVSISAEGVGRRRLMDKQHDIFMLERLNADFKDMNGS